MTSHRCYDKGDPLPEGYREALVQLMSFQADSEYAGAQRLTENQRFVTRPEEAQRLSKKIFEEISHAYAMWMLLQDLGVDVDARVAELARNPTDPDQEAVSVISLFQRHNWQHYFECWEDVALYSLICAPATVIYLSQYQNCSYLPWARASVRIHKEEHGHLTFGIWAVTRCLAHGDEATHEFMQQRSGRFIQLGLDFFGRPSSGPGKSRSFETYKEFGLKVRCPEDLQAEYLEVVESRLRACRVGFSRDESLPSIRHLQSQAVAGF
jgi:ring-1,2-phenylacetyl-CoA epoxidase subunit PaaA